MLITSVTIEERAFDWSGPGWPFESRNANRMDAYPDSATWDPAPFHSGTHKATHLFVAITADGITARYGPIEHPQAMVIREMLAKWLVGRDATCIVELSDRMQRMHRHGRTGIFWTAISAIDLCLWQLRGQVENRPVYRILGGPTRDRIACYASMLGFDITPECAVQRALAFRDKGFTAQKWFFRFGPQHGEEGMKKNLRLAFALREALGETYPLMFDAFMGWNTGYAIDICQRLEPMRPAWVEEPIAPEDLTGWCRIRKSTRVPLASGEHVHGRQQAHAMLSAGVIDILQCDPDWAGGITEMQAIAHLASAHSIPLIAHGHTLLPAMHLAASQPPEAIPQVEYLVNIQEERHALYASPPAPDHGTFPLPAHPGLGVTLK